MNKKGFTLIELLAVIVILSIIALIATPTILGVIEKAKKGAASSSALGYIDAVEKQIMISEVDSATNKIQDGIYSVNDLNVSLKGNKPSNGNIEVKNGEVVRYNLEIDGYYVNNETTEKISKTTKINNGTAIYYNPVTGESCQSSEAVSTTGTKTGCMKWYAFNDKEGSGTVNLILDHNTTATVQYNSYNVNTEMKEVKASLENDTKTWKNVARLIAANEVAKITNNTTFDSKNTGLDWFCLDTNQKDSTNFCARAQSTSLYKWLFDYTSGCTSHGCDIADSSTFGYWTSTPYTGSPSGAWSIYRDGILYFDGASNTSRGVRPVITVLKSKIS